MDPLHRDRFRVFVVSSHHQEPSVGTWSKCRSSPTIQSGCVTGSSQQEKNDPCKPLREPGEDGDTSTEGLAQESKP
uniref:Uncharacterized protein n=1 Tax=Heliothis virescens TaxID=7102 RepID=A0A2A4J7A9_HELVI